MGNDGYLHVQLPAHTLGRMFMQPKTENSAEMGKKKIILLQISSVILATSLCLSVTHPSTCKDGSKSAACLQLVALRSSIRNGCQGLDEHGDGEC